MKKNWFILLMYLVAVGCSSENPKLSFNYIDYSFDDGWTGFCSIRVQNSGIVSVFYDGIRKKEFAHTSLLKEELDSLSILFDKIEFSNLDSVYIESCIDCGDYYLTADKHGEALKIFVRGLHNTDNDLLMVNQLSNYLQTLSKDVLSRAKMVKFESKTDGFIHVHTPPPPMPDE